MILGLVPLEIGNRRQQIFTGDHLEWGVVIAAYLAGELFGPGM
jgi:hypothetical protein